VTDLPLPAPLHALQRPDPLQKVQVLIGSCRLICVDFVRISAFTALQQKRLIAMSEETDFSPIFFDPNVLCLLLLLATEVQLCISNARAEIVCLTHALPLQR
jgi:hypothetical protein